MIAFNAQQCKHELFKLREIFSSVDLVVRHVKLQNEEDADEAVAEDLKKQLEDCVNNLKVMVSQTKKSILTDS